MGMERVHQYRRRQAGFTLLELMIVIAIMAILITLIISYIGKAWNVARRVRCMSNMRQVTLAYFQYVASNDGQLPDCDGDTVVAGKGVDMAVDLPYLRPYIADASALHCSEDLRGDYRTYSVNDYFGGEWLSTTHIRRLERVVNAPATLLLIEEAIPVDRAKTSGGFVILGAPLPVWAHVPAILHEKGTCLGMADGHVEYWHWQDNRTLHLPETPFPRTLNNPDLVKLQAVAGSVNATVN